MGTEANNVLSGLGGDSCGGQAGFPPVQPEMEEQPQVKNLVSHFPTSALGGWESMEQPPNEDMRWGRPGFVIHRAEEGVLGALIGGGSVQAMPWSQAQQSLTSAFQGHHLVSGPGSS